MYVLAVDPGVMNLAIAVIEVLDNSVATSTSTLSLQSLCARTRLAHWHRIDLSDGIKNATHTYLCARLIERLDSMAHLYSQCAAVGIEHQMATNHDANAVQNYAMGYFMCRYPKTHVQLIRPLWKTQYLGPLSIEAGVRQYDLSKYEQRKRWSVSTVMRCRELWKETPDDLYRGEPLNWQYQPRTWLTWDACAGKQDDLADAALMILGWMVQCKGAFAGEPLVLRQRKIRVITQSSTRDSQPTRAQQRKSELDFVNAGTGLGQHKVQKEAKSVRYRRRRRLVRH